MGDCQNDPLRVDFDRRIKLEFHGANVTSDAGLLPYRELDDVFNLTAKTKELGFIDPRKGKNTQHIFTALLRQAVYSRLAGYEDTNDADRLCVDPAMRQVVGGRAKERAAASTSEIGRFETEILSRPKNTKLLMDFSGTWIDRVRRRKRLKKLTLDMDSSVSPTHGQQEGSAYNGYFGCTCYHPLFCFNQFGDLERALLRKGNVHSAHDWKLVLEPVVARYRNENLDRFFRGDAAFANPDMYEYLEEEDFYYAIRIPANVALEREIGHLLKRPRRGQKQTIVRYGAFMYRAQSWDRHRRVVAKVEWHPGQLFPEFGFIVTNIWKTAEEVVRFYNKRGTAEQWIKEGKYAIKWTRLSCHDFKDNQVRLQLFALAYNLANFLRTVALPKGISHWSLTTLKEKLIKIGAKVIRHAGYLTFQMAEVAVPRKVFRAILRRIAGLRRAIPCAAPG